jgi:Short C-terminal domain
MTDRFEALEKLGRLHESGILSDEEFAAEKKRILEGTRETAPPVLTAAAESRVAPGEGGSWLGRNRWAAAGGAAALLIGGYLSYAVLLDVNGAEGPEPKKNAAVEQRQQLPAAGRGELAALLQFDDPGNCEIGGELRALVETLAGREPPAGGGPASATPVRLVGIAEPVTPRIERVAVEGSGQPPVVVQLGLSGGWNGLNVRELRTIRWPGTRASSLQIRFSEPPEQVRRALNERGFNLPAVGELRNAEGSGGRLVAIVVEEVSGGGALTCLRGQPRGSSSSRS